MTLYDGNNWNHFLAVMTDELSIIIILAGVILFMALENI